MKVTLYDWLDNAVYETKRVLNRWWLIVRHRPFFKCPFCNGAGGEMSGYYEREWTECFACYPYWDDAADHGAEWTVGRMPLLRWIRAKVSMACGLWYVGRFRDMLRCRLGWHDYTHILDPNLDPRICSHCYEPEKPTKEPNHD